jgi:hypothetical protein
MQKEGSGARPWTLALTGSAAFLLDVSLLRQSWPVIHDPGHRTIESLTGDTDSGASTKRGAVGPFH